MAGGYPRAIPIRAGVTVVDNRFVPVGVVAELWVDRSVKILRYLEVALTVPEAPDAHVLLPIYYADISKRRVRVRALLAHQFVHVPRIASLDQITAREEDRVSAYYANGLIFSRNAPGLSKRGAA